MGGIPTQENWQASTAWRGKIRSGALNKVDDAISDYRKQGGTFAANIVPKDLDSPSALAHAVI